ncbi:GPI mannosyltransferase 4-like isoform X2 [Amphiura filiformis]
MGAKVWLCLVILRFMVCFYPGQMKGYIHPDQFFQTVEPLAGDIFGFDHLRTWDWNATSPGPIRNILFPYASVGASFFALKQLSTSGYIDISGYTLQAFPRLAMTAASLIADIAVYKTTKSLDLNPWNCLTILASSYATLAFHTRTFTNVFECALFALVLMLVVMSHKDDLLQNKRHFEGNTTNTKSDNNRHVGKKRKTKPKSSIEKQAVPHAAISSSPNEALVGFCLGFIVILGSFCRPTFPAFFIIPTSFWITGSVTSGDIKAVWEIFKRVAYIVPGAFMTFVVCVVMDSIYYGTLDAAILNNPTLLVQNLNLDLLHNITITPLNFIKYNIQNSNLSPHGIHPRITHFLVNVPMLFLPLFVCFLKDAVSFYKTWHDRSLENEISLITSHKLFVLMFLTPIMLLSLIPHQEPRYILPVIVPLVLLYSDSLMKPLSSIPKMYWILFNLIGCIIFGHFHQGGLVPCMEYLHKVATRPIENNPTSFHFVFFHTYMPPQHLLHLQDQILPPFANFSMEKYQHILPKQENVVTIHDLMGSDQLTMFDRVDKILSDIKTVTPKPYQKEIYVISPASLDTIFCRLNVKYNFKLINQFTHHLSMEDPPEWFPSYECVAQPDRSYSRMNFGDKFQAMLSLFVYKVEHVTYLDNAAKS